MSANTMYRDGPHQIKYEAQQITLSYSRDFNTGELTLAWNIPSPVFGCGEQYQAYDGMVIVVSDAPLTSSQHPKNGTFYTGDATLDTDLHAGDTISNARVLFASYNDIVTNSVTVTGLQSSTAYYFTGFAVDKQCIYDPAGAHAYSLPFGREREYQDWPGYQEIRVFGAANKQVNIKSFTKKGPGTQLGSFATGLNSSVTYEIIVCSDIIDPAVSLMIDGSIAQTWDQLIAELNNQIALLNNPAQLSQHPNIGSVLVSSSSQSVHTWDGERYDTNPSIFSDYDPFTAAVDGTVWFNESSKDTFTFNSGAWAPSDAIFYHKLPTSFTYGDVWVDIVGNFSATFNGTTWCKYPVFNQLIDPSLAAPLPDGSLWFNPDTGYTQRWDSEGNCWEIVGVIYSDYDPSALPDGVYWFNYTTSELFLLVSQVWVKQTVKTTKVPPKTPSDQMIWIDTANSIVKQYQFSTNTWEVLDAINWGADPMDRRSCDRWWNSATDEMFVWDFTTLQWVLANNFITSTDDPSLAPSLETNTLWIADNQYFQWDGMQWVEVSSILELETDPSSLTDGTLLIVNEQDAYVLQAGSWTPVPDTIVTDFDPVLNAGQYWYDTANSVLSVWNGITWLTMMFTTTPVIPETGFQYYNTTLSKLLEWRNGKFIDAVLAIEFFVNEQNNMMVTSATVGSDSYVKLSFTPEFKADIRPLAFLFEPVGGQDAVTKTPTYQQVGIGTDGSVDERRELANYVLAQLGYPRVQVPLSKMQLDTCVDDALEMLRHRTSASYLRRYMAMDLLPNQQMYEFSNKKQGLDRVVRVNKVLRTRYGRIGAYSYEDTFGSAMIQQLYYAGSFDILSYHLLASYNELINNVFSNDVMFSWNESSRMLNVQQVLRNKERVLLEVELERTEQEIITDRFLRSWIKKFVLGKAMIILGRMYGKFGSLPGAGGGVSLNGSELATDGQKMIDECILDIEDSIITGLDQYGSSSLIIMG